MRIAGPEWEKQREVERFTTWLRGMVLVAVGAAVTWFTILALVSVISLLETVP